MTIIVHIVLQGIIALFPVPNDNRLTILVPDLTDPHHASDGTPIPIHRALLGYLCDNVVGGCQDVDKQPNASNALYDTWDRNLDAAGEFQKYGVRTLLNYELNIDHQAPASSLTLDLSKVANLAEFAPEASKVEPNFLVATEKFVRPYAALLAARLRLSGVSGTVTHLLPSNDLEYSFLPLHHRFDPDKPVSKTELADEIRIDITLLLDDSAPKFALSFTPFDNQQARPPNLVLQPKASESEITIYLLNLGLCDKWGEPLSSQVKRCIESHSHGGAHHFEVYYDLSSHHPPTQTQLVPQPEKTTASAPPPGQGSVQISPNLNSRPICPQVQFSP
jgi:hypothetical protein